MKQWTKKNKKKIIEKVDLVHSEKATDSFNLRTKEKKMIISNEKKNLQNKNKNSEKLTCLDITKAHTHIIYKTF